MDKNYPDQLGEWVKRRAATTRDRNLVAFLAVRNDVCAALDAGYPAKTIWANLQESQRIAVSYTAFLRYIRKYLERPAKTSDKHQAAARAASVTTSKANKPAGFVFNSTPKKEELL